MWFWYAASSAILAAVVVVLSKKTLDKVSASLVTWSLAFLSLPLIGLMAWISGPSRVNKWFFIGAVGSGTIFALAKTLGLSIIKKTTLSRLVPLTVFNSFFTYLLGLVFLKEVITSKGLLGLGLITLGAYVLYAQEIRDRWWQPFKALLTDKESLVFLVAIFLTSVTAIFDKTAVVNSLPMSPALTLLLENLVITGLIWSYMEKRKPDWKKQLKRNWKGLTLMSWIYGISNVLVFSGFGTGPVALVVGVKQLQIFLVLILGWWWLRDRPTKYSILASMIMILGAILIKIG